ncbi:WbuC family cupin fold metalloprotein [Paraneptunicella aestuarii]|uniref:WbuC family cupin fold metalloprotein n=1 Tax=Paraneptunicella aestuarii TaxID=2831148 RepID=UPI001E4BDD29|nr:WbuC family cupin fold metalloprotein [Paraneptunicella aestuarii]UAA39534.1 WbuC family cupin fold metalloprotein [Paraneptunicella aestuarii]
MKYRTINEAVLYNDEEICTLTKDDLAELSELGLATKEQRTRLCVHEEPGSLVHEMFIIHTNDTYVRPHRHRTKSESFQVLEGEASLVLFDDNGQVQRVVSLGGLASGKTFYFKMPALVWHMLVIHSKVLVFKEVTQGPFDSEDCEFPDWAPTGRHCDEVPEYMQTINKMINHYDA